MVILLLGLVERRGTEDQSHRSAQQHQATATFSKSRCNVQLVRSSPLRYQGKTRAPTTLACLKATLWTIETIKVSEVDVSKAWSTKTTSIIETEQDTKTEIGISSMRQVVLMVQMHLPHRLQRSHRKRDLVEMS